MNLFLLLLLVCGAVKGEWRPITPQSDSESHLSLSLHSLQSGVSLPVHQYQPEQHDQCALYKVSFVQDLYFQYIQYKTSLPDMKEFTVCMWHKFYNHSNDHPLFSYAVPNQPRAIYLWVSNTPRSSYFSLSVESHTFFRLNYPLRLNRWYHSCTSWNGRTGEWQIWVNAERVGRGFHNRLVGHVIPGGGIAITGQEQRQYGGGFLEGAHSPKGSGGLLGEVTQLYLYKAALAAGKAHRDHKHHHGNHASSTPPPPPPVSTGPPLPAHPLLISGQLVPRINIQAQLSRPGGQQQGQSQVQVPLLGQLQQSSSSISLPGQLQSTSTINLPGVSSFSIQHSGGGGGGVSLLGSSDDIQHSLFKRDEEKDTSVEGQDSSNRKKRSTTTMLKKKKFPKKYSQELEYMKLKKLSSEKLNKHKIIKRAIDYDDEDANGHLFEPHSSSLIGGSNIGLLGGDYNPIGIPQQEDEETNTGSSSSDAYPREPAEGEVTQVMNVCSGCAPEPFKKAELISWRNTPKKLYSGALYTLANPECKRF